MTPKLMRPPFKITIRAMHYRAELRDGIPVIWTRGRDLNTVFDIVIGGFATVEDAEEWLVLAHEYGELDLPVRIKTLRRNLIRCDLAPHAQLERMRAELRNHTPVPAWRPA